MQGRIQFEWYDIEQDPEGWDESVSGAGQNLFHRSATLASEQSRRAVRRGVVIKRFGARVCLVGGLVMPQGNGGLFRALSFPPASERIASDLPHKLATWLVYQGITAIRMGSYGGGVEGYQLDTRTGRASDRLEFIHDLSLSEEQRLRAAHADHRRKLRKASQERMALRRIERRQAWTMARLNASWSRRRGERINLMRWISNYRYYRRLTSRLRPDQSANLYGLCDEDGSILSMAYMLEGGGESFYMLGASSEEGYKRGTAVRLFFELARHYPSVGIHTMNCGGVPAEARNERHREFRSYLFKTGFGIEPTLRRSLTLEV